MTKLRQIPYAAVGASAEVVRNVSSVAEKVRDELATKLDEADLTSRFNEFVEAAVVDGRELVAGLPGLSDFFDAGKDATATVATIPGVGTSLVSKLRPSGITSITDLAQATTDRTARRHLAAETGIDEDEINRIGNLADLMQVDSITPRHAELLDAAGVVSTRQLRRRSATSLHETLTETNKTAKVLERVPALDIVNDWIEKADNVAS